MPDNRKPLKYGAFPVCRNYTVRAHLRHFGPAERGGRENRLFHSRPLQRWFHPGHLRPRHHHRPAGGGQENGRGFGAEGAVRKIPGAGMRWYPLQSLTQTKGEAVWVRYGSGGKSEEKKEQAGHRSPPVPGCGSAGEFWRIRRRVALTGNSLLLKVVQILPRTKRKIPANPQGVCWNSLVAGAGFEPTTFGL